MKMTGIWDKAFLGSVAGLIIIATWAIYNIIVGNPDPIRQIQIKVLVIVIVLGIIVIMSAFNAHPQENDT